MAIQNLPYLLSAALTHQTNNQRHDYSSRVTTKLYCIRLLSICGYEPGTISTIDFDWLANDTFHYIGHSADYILICHFYLYYRSA